ncbi:phospholipase [Serratia marcescens]|nr:phospholipase [Serratia marcescens]ELQ9440599.1 phospholipase [Serratia marcescens]ELT5562039.1 phospholipase [Serratia marcescens]
MFSSLKLLYITGDIILPDEFPRIISPSRACHELSFMPDSDILSLFSGFHGGERIRREVGITQNGISSNLRGKVQSELMRGTVVAVETRPGVLATMGPFYADTEGYLRPQGQQVPNYPVEKIVRRYEDAVKSYGGRRARPSIFPAQVTRAKPAIGPDNPAQSGRVSQQAVAGPMTKAERWQERKYLIGRGQRSIYPDARIASERLAENNVAVEKAKLAENIYKTTDPLKETPGVPEGWKDISNDNAALRKIGLNRSLLYDRGESPDFLARVYQPDNRIFGNDMNPTVVFRGSRAPEFPEGIGSAAKKALKGDLSGIKNVKDWTNNGAQAAGFNSAYYESAVKLGDKISKFSNIDITGHSLGGGMASAASMASGKPAWTFNAAGLNPGTVEKYGATVMGTAKDIQAYRVDGELLTSLQEVHTDQDYALIKNMLPAALQKPWGVSLPYTLKEWGSIATPQAVGVPHTLSGGVGSLLDKHGIGQTIELIEGEKDDDIATIKGRI